MEALKRAICRALTTVVGRSALKEQVDPKSFHMTLVTSFAVLQSGNGLDLRPLWPTLAQVAPMDDPRLAGIFLGFAHTLRGRFGIPTILPEPVEALPDAEKQRALDTAFTTAAVEAVVESVDESETTDEMLVSLGSQDLVPVVADDLRRELVNTVTQSLKASPAGPLIDGAQLAYVLDSKFLELFDGKSLDLGPIVEALRTIDGYTDQAGYVGFVFIHRRLSERGLQLLLPELDVDPVEGQRLVAEAEAKAKAERRRHSNRETSPVAPSPRSESGTNDQASARTATPEGGSKKERDLRRYNLLGLSSARWRLIRMSIAAVVLLSGLVFAWVTRPNRPLDAEGWGIELTKAEIYEGRFVGVLDEKHWYEHPIQLRPRRVERLTEALKERGVLNGARIVNARGDLVIREKAGHMNAARVVLESPDGITPPPPGPAIDPKTGKPFEPPAK